MTGLAASFDADSAASADSTARNPAVVIAEAQARRGPAAASWRGAGIHLVVRAELPAVHRLGAGALLLAGDASASLLASAYAQRGAPALGTADGTYALILADLRREALILARGGDGPPLHWARHGPTVLAASEPAALLAAGLPAEPDWPVVHRFLATGECDDTPATFFAGVQRVLPGQVVEISRGPDGCQVVVHEPAPAPPVAAEAAVTAADYSGRIGVRLGCGLGAAAILAVSLAATGRPRPLPVYSTTFPELAAVDSSAHCAATLLSPYGLGAARHRAVPFLVGDIDIDAYLADLGEPTPALTDWLCWELARRLAGQVDALIDAAAGPQLSRLADRIASRYGVALRLPLREVPEADRRAALAGLAQRLLPSSAAGFAAATQPDPTAERLLPDLLRELREELVTTFLDPRAKEPPGITPAKGEAGPLAQLLRLLAGGRIDAHALWRRYLVERWLQQFPYPVDHGVSWRVVGHVAPKLHDQREREGGRPGVVGGWWAQPVATEVFRPSDQLPEKVAWYVSEAAPASAGAPWCVLLAAKPVAVMQGRARHLWEIRPGPTAQLLHRLAGRRLAAAGLTGTRRSAPHPPDPRRRGLVAARALQVAIEAAGWWRMVAATLAAVLGRPAWAARLAGAQVRAIRQPRLGAPPPGQIALVAAPQAPDQLATEVVSALRSQLPPETYATLGGCAVVTDEVIGWAARPGAPPLPGGVAGLAALAATDPFGDAAPTPIVLTLPAGILSGHGGDGGDPAAPAATADGSEQHAGGVVRSVPAPPGAPGVAGSSAQSQPRAGSAERRQGG